MGGKKATSTSQVSIPPEVLARYNAINARAETAASKPFQAFGSNPADYVAQMNEQQALGTGTVNRSGGPAYAGIDNYMTPYTKNVADTTGAYLRQQQEQAQSGALGTAASSGAFGGDRAGIAAANLQQQNQMAYGKTMADIMNQGYTQALGASQADLNRGLQAGQMQLAAGTMQQQTEQAGKDAMINRFMQEQGLPYQQAQFLANIALGTGAASGSTTTSTQPIGFFGNLAANGGRINGYAEGGGVAGPMSHSKEAIGGVGYVPEPNLPIGQLMVSQPPEQQEDKSGDIVAKVLAMIGGGGKKDGGAIDARHGYATDGYVGPNSREEALARYDALLNRNERSENLPRGDRTENLSNDFLIASGIQPLNDSYMPPQGGVAPARPMPQRPISLTPQSATTPDRPMPARPISLTPPQGGVSPAFEMPERPISLTPRSSLAPTESPRPLPRPTTGVAGGADIAADTMSVIGNTPAATGVVAPTVAAPSFAPQVSPKTDTGEAPQGGYTPIIPLKTQLQFITKELQQPEYSGYLKQTYASPFDAAVAFDSVYERSGGKGNREAGLNANDIYRAAQNGDMGNLPPNVVEAYNHFIENGMDPIQASGAAGRLMVESYSHLDPNARNTIGGGYGTYGIAQHRGERLEQLAEFAGVPLQALIDAPVSTPEGRYYSHGGDGGGLGGAGNDNMAPTDNGGLAAGQKAYEDRNAVGKFFNRPEGGLDQNAILSLLSGLGTMASSRSVSPFTAILQGLGGGAETYKGLLKQNADIDFTKAQTANEGVQLFKNSIYYNEALGQTFVPLQGGGVQTFADFMVKPAGASMAGVAADQVMRSIAGSAESRGVDLATATPEQIFGSDAASVAPSQDQTVAPQNPAAGMPVPQVVAPYKSFGTFALDANDQAYIQQAEARSRSAMTPQEREALTTQAAATRMAADNGTASAGMSFRNMNELAVTVAKAAKDNNLGPLGDYKADIEALATQVAGQFGVQYDGTAATARTLLNKLSSLSADQMTADTAAASLYLQNKGIFPNIDTDTDAAADITAEMMTKNMTSYEKGQFINDIYRAQNGTVKDLTGVEALFNKKAGALYQVEKTNIADLLKYAGNERGDAELRQLVVDFFDSANSGAFENQAEAQKALEEIFGAMYANSPEQHRVSESLGRYFVQQGNS
jgi:hypothetical protein